MTTSRVERIGALEVAELVRCAAAGESWAWERLADQYSRLIWAITRDFKLGESDAADVSQVTWLRLLENIHKIENPDRVGSWLAATARNECLRCLANRKRVVLAEDEDVLQSAVNPEPEVDEGLLLAEREQMVREAMARLPWRWQRMLELLMADPPASYAEISDQLGLPVGSIGPTRRRCLTRLRVLLHSSLSTGFIDLVRIVGIPTTARREFRVA
jgi:RNA polymerase sigma factor (sigma-70 family)